ncbi:hypothetical protein EMIT0111MI5_60044 [Burkholderia sp. IT-111MI5]
MQKILHRATKRRVGVPYVSYPMLPIPQFALPLDRNHICRHLILTYLPSLEKRTSAQNRKPFVNDTKGYKHGRDRVNTLSACAAALSARQRCVGLMRLADQSFRATWRDRHGHLATVRLYKLAMPHGAAYRRGMFRKIHR